MMLKDVKITHRDSCKTYPLKRIGLGHIIDWEFDTPTIKDLYTSDMFQNLDEPQIGCVLIWIHKTKDATDGYWIPQRITEDGKVISIKRFDYGHCGVYENQNMVSDVSWEDGQGTIIRMRNYDDLPKPDYILKLIKT
jgi:hypothetical protein